MKNNRIDAIVALAFFVGLLSSFAGTMYFAFLRSPPVSLPPLLDMIGIVLATLVLAGPGYDAYLPDLKLTARLFDLMAIWVLAVGFLFLDRYKEATLLVTGLVLLISAIYELSRRWTPTPINRSTLDKRAT